MAESGVLDPAALDELLETTGGDPDFLAELIDAYVEDTAALFASMRQAVKAGDAEELRRAAHSVKSTSASFGARRLAALCQGVEERAKAGALDGATDDVADAETEYEKVTSALQAVRPQG